ncbi:MAG: hypothetical protein KatS3mg052_1227 [Candidatus Roseilinea sp.]|nr:MAG: hypothetical protein KatS3mg052_1227 [Candidatus Roseilinea sp.]
MNLKKLGLGVQFEMVLPEDRPLSENDPALKAMQEAARQLGLTFEVAASADPEKKGLTPG